MNDLTTSPQAPAIAPAASTTAAGHTRADGPITYIRPQRGWVALDLSAMWEYRELIYFFVVRDLTVRYRQTLLGASWAILQPLMAMAMFTVFFSRWAGSGSEGLPYPVFCFAGLLPWTFVSQALTRASNSLIVAPNLLKKVYFPRLIVPSSSVFASIADLACSSVVLLLLMAAFGVWPELHSVALLPVPLLIAIGTAMGMSFWFSSLNAAYRDLQYVFPYLIQLWLFASPVIYPASSISTRLAALGLPGWLYGLNPMAGAVEGFRVAVLGAGTAGFAMLSTSFLVMLVVLVSGAYYFRRVEKVLVDSL
jgi:homopolymeric O-antigen transport system permease protein